MKRIYLLCFAAQIAVSQSFAQKKKITLEESMTNPAFNMSIRQLHGFKDGSYGEVVAAGKKGDAIIKISKGKTDTILFASAWKSDKKNFPRINWKSENELHGMWGNELITYNLATKQSTSVSKLAEGAENEDLEETSMAVAYTLANNLFIQKGPETIHVTNETNKDILNGSAGVHRNEYGISKGTFWSPKGSSIAFYRMDQSMVTDYPIVELAEKPAKVRNIKYPMAGQTSHEVKLAVYNLASRKTVFMEVTGPKDQYLTGVTWTPDEKYITISVLSRETNALALNVYDAQTGKFVKKFLEETSTKYLDPQEGPTFINSALDFVWLSERNGFNHAYVYGFDGTMKRQLTSGNEKVTELLGLDEKGQNLVYIQTGGQGMDRIVKSVDLKSGKGKILTSVSGMHNPLWCDGKAKLLDVWSNVKTPKQLDLVDLNGKAQMLKTWANPFAEYEFPQIDTLSVKSSDGQIMHARLIKPTNFDPNKKYPVIVYTYGGPHAQLVTNSWMAAADKYMAAWATDGFVVFTLDNRGSYNRGVAFEQVPYRNLGTPEMEDQLEGVKYLKSLPYVDGSRIGVQGWSYGGFMTTTLMTRAPGVFKVGIAGAPVIDWSMYEIMYTERYMDTPKENPTGYETANCINHADKVKGKFMLIHGTSDDVVVWQNTQAFLKKAIESGVQLDYFIYPGHGHGVGGKDRLHLMRKMTNYFKDNL